LIDVPQKSAAKIKYVEFSPFYDQIFAMIPTRAAASKVNRASPYY